MRPRRNPCHHISSLSVMTERRRVSEVRREPGKSKPRPKIRDKKGLNVGIRTLGSQKPEIKVENQGPGWHEENQLQEGEWHTDMKPLIPFCQLIISRSFMSRNTFESRPPSNGGFPIITLIKYATGGTFNCLLIDASNVGPSTWLCARFEQTHIFSSGWRRASIICDPLGWWKFTSEYEFKKMNW